MPSAVEAEELRTTIANSRRMIGVARSHMIQAQDQISLARSNLRELQSSVAVTKARFEALKGSDVVSLTEFNSLRETIGKADDMEATIKGDLGRLLAIVSDREQVIRDCERSERLAQGLLDATASIIPFPVKP